MLGFGDGNFLEYLVGATSWNAPGNFVSPPKRIQSFVTSNNGGTADTSMMETLTAEDFFYNKGMLPLMRNWELVKTVLKVYTSTISEILINSIPTVSGAGEHDDDVNNFIKKIGLTDNLIDNLEDDLYYGQRAFLIDYKKLRIYDIKNSKDIIIIKKCGKLYKYADRLEDIVDKINTDKLYASSKIGYVGFNLRKVAGRCTGKRVQDPLFKDRVEDITYYQGTSILSGSMYLLFEHMLKSLLRLLLTLKNTTRPDIVQVQINKEKTSEVNISDAVSAIESLLNQGEYTFDLRSSNVTSIVQTLYNSIINSVKVVPTLNNISGLDILQQPPIGDKIDKLTSEINDTKTNILLNTGIPEDALGSGSNKWEILSRSARFNTLMNDIINQLSYTYKLVSHNYLLTKNIRINMNNLKVNIDTSSYLTDSNFTSRSSLLADKLSKLKDILTVASELEDLGDVSKDRMRNYIRDNLRSTDAELLDLLKTEKEIKKEKVERDDLDNDSGFKGAEDDGFGGGLGGL